MSRSGLGEGHTFTLKVQSNLASLYVEMKRFAEAEAAFKKLLAVQLEKYGPEHPLVFTAQGNYAGLLLMQGRFSDAEPLCRKAWEGRLGVFGAANPAALAAMNKLGQVLVMEGKYAEAEALLGEHVASVQEALPVDHQERIAFHTLYARCLAAQKRYEEAEPHMLAYYEGVKRLAHGDESLRRSALRNLIGFYERWGHLEKAAPYKVLLSGEDPGRQKE